MTETAQPDPAAEWRAQKIEEGRRMIAAMSPERRADLEEMLGKDPGALGPELTEAFGLTPRPPKPLTVADIPAGQGVASLFIGTHHEVKRSGLGERALMWKRSDGSIEVVDWPPADQMSGDAALWEHLAATLPTVTEGPQP